MGLFHKLGSMVTTIYVILLNIDDICHALIWQFLTLKKQLYKELSLCEWIHFIIQSLDNKFRAYEKNRTWDFFISLEQR